MERQISRRNFCKMGIIAAAGLILGNTLTGCGNKNDDINIMEVFNNNESFVDEAIKSSVPYDETLINELSELEYYINIIIENEKIFNDVDDSRKLLLESLANQNQHDINLSSLQNDIKQYNELKKHLFGFTEEKKAIEEKLYCKFLIINNYLRLNGYDIVSDFGVEMVKSIVVHASEYEFSKDNITIHPIIDPEEGTARISYENGYQSGVIIVDNGITFNLINAISECQTQAMYLANEEQPLFDGSYNKERLELLLESINVYKGAFNYNFEIETDFFNKLTLKESKVNEKTR